MLFTMMLVSWYLIFISIFMHVYRKSDRPAKTKKIKKKVENIPSFINPGNLSNLLYKKIVPEAFTSTILVLIRKGILKVETIGGKKTIFVNRNNDVVLSSSQKYVIKILIDSIGNGNSVTFDEIKNYNKVYANNSSFYINYQIWIKMMVRETSDTVYHELKNNHYTVTYIKYWAIILFAINFFEQFRLPLGFFIVFPAFYLPVYYYDAYRRTKEGQAEFEEWIGHKNHLESLNENNNPNELVYAPLLKVNNLKVLDYEGYVDELNDLIKKAIAKSASEGRKGSII